MRCTRCCARRATTCACYCGRSFTGESSGFLSLRGCNQAIAMRFAMAVGLRGGGLNFAGPLHKTMARIEAPERTGDMPEHPAEQRPGNPPDPRRVGRRYRHDARRPDGRTRRQPRDGKVDDRHVAGPGLHVRTDHRYDPEQAMPVLEVGWRHHERGFGRIGGIGWGACLRQSRLHDVTASEDRHGNPPYGSGSGTTFDTIAA